MHRTNYHRLNISYSMHFNLTASSVDRTKAANEATGVNFYWTMCCSQGRSTQYSHHCYLYWTMRCSQGRSTRYSYYCYFYWTMHCSQGRSTRYSYFCYFAELCAALRAGVLNIHITVIFTELCTAVRARSTQYSYYCYFYWTMRCCQGRSTQYSYYCYFYWTMRCSQGRKELFQQFLWQVELPQLAKEVQPMLGLFYNGVYVIVPLQVLRNCGAQESEWLHCSHSAVHDGERGESRGVSPEVHDHLHGFEIVELQVVKTAPDSQLFNLLSVSRLVTVLDEADQCGVICKL